MPFSYRIIPGQHYDYYVPELLFYKEPVTDNDIACTDIFFVWLNFEAHKLLYGRRHTF
jgi:hypothetical protein